MPLDSSFNSTVDHATVTITTSMTIENEFGETTQKSTDLKIIAYLAMSFAFVVILWFLAINVKRLIRNNNTQICWKHEPMHSQDYVNSNQRGLSNAYSFNDTDEMVGRSRGDEDFSNQDNTSAIPHVGYSNYAEIHKANTGGLRNGTGLNQPKQPISHRDIYAEINTDLVIPASSKKTDTVVPIYAKVNKKK